MRELKFRAWTMGVMLYSGKDFSTVPVNNQPLATKDGGMATNLELMQYTGLKDKNGNDVYESDIIKWEQQADVYGTDTEQAVVKFTNGCFTPIGYDGNDEFYSRDIPTCEVIGNIYENPELLNNG